jgi:uncharacterized membrane protein
MILRTKKFFITTFIGGALVLLPATIFILLIKLIFQFVHQLVSPISQWFDFGAITNQLLIDLISVGLILAFCFLVGLFVQTQIGHNLFSYLEANTLARLPFYSTIKETVQQFAGNKKNSPFSRAVMVDLYSNATRMTGFVTDESENGYLTIFVPTGPNPTNGLIFHVLPEQVEYLDVKTEEAMRSVIGVGAGTSKIWKKTSS